MSATQDTPGDGPPAGWEAELGARARLRWDEDTRHATPTPTATSEDVSIIEAALAQTVQGDARVVPLPPRRSRVWVVALGTAAAAVLVWVLRPTPPAVGEVPRYAAHFEGGVRATRGDAPAVPGPVVLQPGSRIVWSFAPATATTTAVGLRIAARGPGDAVRCLDPSAHVRIADTGAIELAGAAEAVLGLETGRWSLTAIVGPADRLIATDEACTSTDPALVALDTRDVELVATP